MNRAQEARDQSQRFRVSVADVPTSCAGKYRAILSPNMVSDCIRNTLGNSMPVRDLLERSRASLAFFFHHDGTSPQRMGTSSHFESRSITASIILVGQILYRACRLRSGVAGAVSL